MRRTRSGNSWITSIFQNNDLKTEVNICISKHIAIFETVSTYLSTVISRLLPATQPSPGRYGWRRQINSYERGGRGVRGGQYEWGGGRGRGGIGGRGGQGKLKINQIENGVYISYPTRWYEKKEWSRLSCKTQQRILKDPARKHAVNERLNKKRKTTNTTDSVATKEVNPKQNRLAVAIINVVHNSPQYK